MAGYFKQLIQSGELIRVFSTGRLLHPVALEMFHLAGGYHGFWLDQEHSGLTAEQVQMAAISARAAGMGCFVRMPVTHYSLASQNLESGVDGVMGARVESAAHAEQFVSWTKFGPRGMRGMNTAAADGHYTHRSSRELAEIANRESFVAVQIECRRAVEEIETIAGIDGLDLLFIGPNDLAQDYGYVGQTDHELVWSAIDQVAGACRRHGKAWGIVPHGAEYAQKCVDKGCTMITVGSELAAMRMGIAALKNSYASLF